MAGSSAGAKRQRGNIERRAGCFRVRVSAGKDPATGERLMLTETVPIAPPGGRKAERDRDEGLVIGHFRPWQFLAVRIGSRLPVAMFEKGGQPGLVLVCQNASTGARIVASRPSFLAPP